MIPQLVTDPLCCNSILFKNPPLCIAINSQPIMTEHASIFFFLISEFQTFFFQEGYFYYPSATTQENADIQARKHQPFQFNKCSPRFSKIQAIEKLKQKHYKNNNCQTYYFPPNFSSFLFIYLQKEIFIYNIPSKYFLMKQNAIDCNALALQT